MEALLKDSVTQAGCSRRSQVTDNTNILGVPKYKDASENLGTLALSCSKSLWLFYVFCQRFLKPIKRDKFLFKEIFLLYYVLQCELLVVPISGSGFCQ